jgi:hypothetical protein
MVRRMLLCILILVMLSSSCIGSFVSSPPLVDFSVAISEIQPGIPTTLRWEVSNASSVSIDNGIGRVGSNGEKTVKPSADTTYTITAVNSAGTSTRSVTVKILSMPMGLATNHFLPLMPLLTLAPGISGITGPTTLTPTIIPRKTYKTYAETLYDFVAKAPSAAWTENSMSGQPGFWEDVPFPSSTSVRSLKYWDNIILEGNNTFKESLFIKLSRRWDASSGKHFDTILTGDYEVSIPLNSWFTAKIGFPGMVDPPENKPLVRFWINYTPIGPANTQCYTLASSQIYASYDNYVDQIDVDLSKEFGGILCGTSGYFTLVITNEFDPETDLPIVLTDVKIAH